jgi:D-alanyl-D-alanine carboxypeptidase (penicillin-binding protein 5/6)
LIVGAPAAATSARPALRHDAAAHDTTTSVPTTTTSSSTTTTTTSPPSTTTTIDRALAWPAKVSAAVAVPGVSVLAVSARQNRRPIASLTKMMTAWVVLQRLPLGVNGRGPCHRVDAHDVAVYRYDVSTGQSNAAVARGEVLCENMLLTGLLVHSAGNYAYILLRILRLGAKAFVALMNQTAIALGLLRTHYADPTGIDPGNTSTAADQAVMAADLMSAQPIVRAIVHHPTVRLPVAGVVDSYTPLVGQYGVIGVKSGFTFPAGGCDVMALRMNVGPLTIVVYAAVLGERGNDPLGASGNDALALARSLRRFLAVRETSTGPVVVWTGSPDDVVTTTTTTSTTTTTTPTSTTSTTLPASTTTSSLP